MSGQLRSVTRWYGIIRRTIGRSRGACSRSVSALAQRSSSPPGGVEGEQVKLTSSLAEDSGSALFYRHVDAVVRDGNKREKLAIRKEGLWIPSCLQGRGKVPDMLLSVPLAPVQDDFLSGLFALQKLGKTKWSGPLYQLRIVPDGSGVENPLPFDSIRVKAHNMLLNQVTEVPKTIAFVYCPENEPVRVRIPIRHINAEKCPGLRDGGWLNRMVRDVDVNVAPFTRPPLHATMDVGGMRMKDRRTVADLQFEGKGNGCRTVLPDDTTTTMISKI